MTLALVLALSAALAQDPQAVDWVDPAAAEEAEKPETDLSVELGGSWTTGNSVAITGYGALAFGHKWDMNRFSVTARGAMGSNIPDLNGDGIIDDTERDGGLKVNTRRVGGKARYDRFFTDADSLYVLAGGFHDPFAGFAWRLHEQVGYSRKIVDKTRTIGEGDDAVELKTQFIGEIGVDYAQERYTDADPDFTTFVAGRAYLGFFHAFTPATSFSEEVEVYENFFTLEDFRLINDVSLSTKLNSILSLKLSHNLIFYNRPPNPDLRNVDQTLLLTLVASLL